MTWDEAIEANGKAVAELLERVEKMTDEEIEYREFARRSKAFSAGLKRFDRNVAIGMAILILILALVS